LSSRVELLHCPFRQAIWAQGIAVVIKADRQFVTATIIAFLIATTMAFYAFAIITRSAATFAISAW
jgi:hypothetical protein